VVREATSTTKSPFDPETNSFQVEGLGGRVYRLARDAILDAWSADWPGWCFVRMTKHGQPVLVRAPWHRLHAAHRPPRRYP
jgi:hypothetical protein